MRAAIGISDLGLELIELFLSELPGRVEALETAVRDADPAMLLRAAHRLRAVERWARQPAAIVQSWNERRLKLLKVRQISLLC